jgi:hypothetical protein
LEPKKLLTRNQNPVLIGAMKTKTFALILAICFLASGACFASPFQGTWKLNPAKSKLGHGMGRNTQVVYGWAFPARTKVTIDGTDAHGKPMRSEWIGEFDGKDYPVTGDPNSDTRGYREVNDHTLDFWQKKNGKVTLNGQIVVAADGKSRTVTAWDGYHKHKRIKTVAVYDKTAP